MSQRQKTGISAAKFLNQLSSSNESLDKKSENAGPNSRINSSLNKPTISPIIKTRNGGAVSPENNIFDSNHPVNDRPLSPNDATEIKINGTY